MKYQLNYLASLSFLDQHHDELKEEFGDLPIKVEEARIKTQKLKELVNETKTIIKNNAKFAKEAKIALVELKEKEEKLAKQQFEVKNNKQFDAITQEIEYVQNEYKRIVEELSTNGVKEENLQATLKAQEDEYKEAKKELKELEKELNEISDDQNEEVKKILDIRNKYIKKLSTENLELYNRIRRNYEDAVVEVRKNSCTGCYSQIPPQKVVEIRTNLDHIFTCEHCGRILYTDDIELDKQLEDL